MADVRVDRAERTGWGGRTADRLGSTVHVPDDGHRRRTDAVHRATVLAGRSRLTPGQPFKLNGFNTAPTSQARYDAFRRCSSRTPDSRS